MIRQLRTSLLYATCLLTQHMHCASNANCALRAANMYTDHMVLQRSVDGRGAFIRGFTGNVAETIVITVHGQSVTTVSYPSTGDTTPTWNATLMEEAGGPYDISIESDKCLVTLKNVLFGDVWICSGQSNMEHTLADANNGEEFLKQINSKKHMYIRVLRIVPRASNTEAEELHEKIGGWNPPNLGLIKRFSAVCWMFGTKLWDRYKIPIGLVLSASGGTPIEAWSSPHALLKCFGNSNGREAMRSNALKRPFIHSSKEYECALSAMISDWRGKWSVATNNNTSPLFPVGVVQLAPHRNIIQIKKGFPDIRWAQSGLKGNLPTKNLPHTFMAVAIDVPEFTSKKGSIHPTHKRQIVERLVMGARALAYGEKVIFQGPLPTSFNIDHHVRTISIQYDCQNTILEQRGKNNIFEICCSEELESSCSGGSGYRWVAVSMISVTKTAVELRTSCQEPQKVVGVRYAWMESPCYGIESCPVYADNLPGPPFIMTGLHNLSKNQISQDCKRAHILHSSLPSEELQQTTQYPIPDDHREFAQNKDIGRTDYKDLDLDHSGLEEVPQDVASAHAQLTDTAICLRKSLVVMNLSMLIFYFIIVGSK